MIPVGFVPLSKLHLNVWILLHGLLRATERVEVVENVLHLASGCHSDEVLKCFHVVWVHLMNSIYLCNNSRY